MHIPKETVTSESPHEIIALIGAPGSGKTTSCLTFPNPIFYDFDHKLPAGTSSIPVWDPAWVNSYAKATLNIPNRRDAFKKHLRTNHALFTPEQTLVIDSWTIMQNAFDQQTQPEEDMADKPNPFSFWKRKAQYSVEIMEMLKACKCKVVVTFHETVERDAEGELTGKLRPVMDGSFKDQLLGHFTDVWRMLCDPYEKDPATGKILMDGANKKVKRGYFWQLKGDALVNTNTNPILGAIIRAKNISMVPADYQNIMELYASK